MLHALSTCLVLATGAAAGDGAERLFPVVKDGRWGYVDRAGSVVVAPRFDRAGEFSEGLAAVQLGAVRGYADATGAIVLVPRHEPAGPVHRPFRSGRAAVRVGALHGYIDRSGALAIPARYTTAEDFTGGYAMVCLPDGCGYVDPEGRGVIAAQFMGSDPVSGGLACVNVAMGMGRRRTAIYRVGGIRIAADLEGCGLLSEGLIAVRVAGRWGYLDASGDPAIPPRFDWAGDFASGRAPARDASGRCGYIDRRGEVAIPFRYRSCERFSDGLALVDLAEDPFEAERLAFVDPSGKTVIVAAELDPPFDSADGFRDGLAAVGTGGAPHLAGAGGSTLGYVDRNGRYVWKPTR